MITHKLRSILVIALITVMLAIPACSGGDKTKPTIPPVEAKATQAPSPTEDGNIPSPAPTTGDNPWVTPKSLEEALANGKPTLAEFGSTTCIYCKQMKLILAELAKDYQEKINIIIIDVNENYDYVPKYGIVAIPTQIFFDSKGNIVLKHIGLFPKEDIIAQLKKMGIE